jgi:hypothetical protein
MPRKIGVSGLLGESTASKSVNLTELPEVPKSSLMSVMRFLKALYLAIAIDLSGSYAHKAEIIFAAIRRLIARIAADEEMRNLIHIDITGMSGIVRSTGFHLAADSPQLELPPGGGSPQGKFVVELMRVEKEQGANDKDTVRVHVIIGDGMNNDETDEYPDNKLPGVIKKYTSFQKENNLHTFVVTLKDGHTPINYDFMSALSIKHEVYDEGEGDIDRVFENIFLLMQSASRDVKTLAATKSLKLADLQSQPQIRILPITDGE